MGGLGGLADLGWGFQAGLGLGDLAGRTGLAGALASALLGELINPGELNPCP
jgi:hypothetical protein